MNAAFLLVTTAWLAGADAAPAAAPPAPAAPAAGPAVIAPIAPGGSCQGAGCNTCGGDCGSCCDSCCDSGCGKQGLLSRLRGLCHRNKCDDCCDTCQPACAPVATCNTCNTCNTCDTCDSGCGRKHRFHRNKGNDCCNTCEVSCGSCGSCGDTCCDDGCGKQGFFARLRARCHRNKCDDCCNSCDSGCGNGCGAAVGAPAYGAPGALMPKAEPIPAPKEPAKKMPSEKTDQTSIIPEAPKATLSVETETKNPFELHRRYESRVGHAADYSWLTGQLFYVHADGGLWVLRYAPLSQEDPNGGGIVLARDLRMDSYHEGDLVTVHGEIINQQRSTVFLGGPLYRASSIQLVDRQPN